MRQERGFIVNIVAIIVVLGIGFLSQTSHFNAQGEQIKQETGNYWVQAQEWVKSNVYPRVSTEIKNRGGQLSQEVEEQKNNFAQNIWDGIRNYLQKNFNYIFKTTVE